MFEGVHGMKKLAVLGMIVFLLLASASISFGMEVQAKGYWWIEGVMRNGWDFLGKGAGTSEDKTINIEQKLRTQFQFIANENLRGVLDTQIGTTNWGSGMLGLGSGRSIITTAATIGANQAGYGNIMLRQGYVEYKWPNTLVNIKIGFQTMTLPAAFGGGSAILDDQVAAAVVSTPLTDNISLLAGYARPYEANSSQTSTTSALTGSGTATDVVFAALPVTLKGATIIPFAAYANAGATSTTARPHTTTTPPRTARAAARASCSTPPWTTPVFPSSRLRSSSPTPPVRTATAPRAALLSACLCSAPRRTGPLAPSSSASAWSSAAPSTPPQATPATRLATGPLASP